MNIEQLFTAACNGKIDKLREYFEQGGARNIRYNRFGINHSLIAGAFRNRQTETVKYLISVGETPTEKEAAEEFATENLLTN